MDYADASAIMRRTLPPAVAVSTVAFALQPPAASSQINACGEQVDVAADLQDAPSLWVPLVRRIREPFLGRWALPGGPTHWDETLADTALQSIRAATGHDPGYLEQLYAFGGVERSADAQRLVTIAYWALFGETDLTREADLTGETDLTRETDLTGEAASPGVAASDRASAAEHAAPRLGARRWDDPAPVNARSHPSGFGASGRHADATARADTSAHANATAQTDASAPGGASDVSTRFGALSASQSPDSQRAPESNVAWCAADRLPKLAFDHSEIVEYALARLRSKTEYAAVAHRFLGAEFTIARLRAVHEAVLGYAVDPANFRRQTLSQGTLIDTGARETGTRHRPARLYRFREDAAPIFPTDRPEPRSRT